MYVLVSPDESQWVVMGDTQADGFVKAQMTNLDKVLQVKARTQAEFDTTLNKRKPASGGPNTNPATYTLNLTGTSTPVK